MCDRCIEWGGYKWHRYGEGYYERGSGGKTVRLHRAVWESERGTIPEGCVIHHINENKADNSIGNLELVTNEGHSADSFEGKVGAHRHVAARRAKEARARQMEERKKRMLLCSLCGGEYHSGAVHPRRFCSSKCLEAARSGAFTAEERTCERCGAKYLATQRGQKYCSPKCNNQQAQERQANREEREVACAQCGKVIRTTRANARFCSRQCAVTYHGHHQFRGKIGPAR